LAEKLDVQTIIIPTSAGVGSAVGFLLAAVSFEIVRTRYSLLDESFNASSVEELRKNMREEAEAIIRQADANAALTEVWTADMRYHGQGHELAVSIPPNAPITPEHLKSLFEHEYLHQFGRVIPGVPVEVLNWTLRLSAPEPKAQPCPQIGGERRVRGKSVSKIVDSTTGESADAEIHLRVDLAPGDVVGGPALIVEDETTTLVATNYEARINGLGYIVLTRS
jgi:N-methylhydantoinase A